VPPAIEVQGLEVRYGTKVAVDGIDLRADPGEVVALLGPNGAGKTTTVETLEGYRHRRAGKVAVLGLDPGRPADHRRLTPRFGVMLQKGGVYPGMSPREAVRLFASYYEHPLEPAGLLDRLDLTAVAATPWRRLSGGEQQRLALALALVGQPEVVFLDEPTAGVDPRGRVAIREVVAGLRSDGVCVLLTTHELEEAERLADRVVIMDCGRVVATGTTAELTGPSGDGTIRFSAPPGLDVGALGEAAGAEVAEIGPGEYAAVPAAGAPSAPKSVAAITAWLAERDLAVTDLRTHSRLEDVFLRLTDRDAE
jgi:ABC-2 type transport system ATP-binding protein